MQVQDAHLRQKHFVFIRANFFMHDVCNKNKKRYPGGVDGDGELHQSPRPDDQDHHAQDFVGVHLVILQLQRNTLVGFKALKDSMDISCNHSC